MIANQLWETTISPNKHYPFQTRGHFQTLYNFEVDSCLCSHLIFVLFPTRVFMQQDSFFFPVFASVLFMSLTRKQQHPRCQRNKKIVSHWIGSLVLVFHYFSTTKWRQILKIRRPYINQQFRFVCYRKKSQFFTASQFCCIYLRERIIIFRLGHLRKGSSWLLKLKMSLEIN